MTRAKSTQKLPQSPPLQHCRLIRLTTLFSSARNPGFPVGPDGATDGKDIIIGTEGNDVINGLRGRDQLTGLGGSDDFVFEGDAIVGAGADPDDIDVGTAVGDNITDFNVNEDRLVLDGEAIGIDSLELGVNLKISLGDSFTSDRQALESSSPPSNREAGVFVYFNARTESVRVLQYEDYKLENVRDGRAGFDLQLGGRFARGAFAIHGR